MNRKRSHRHRRPGTEMGPDASRRRWIRRVLLAWITLSLVAALFFAYSRSRARMRIQSNPQNLRRDQD